MFIEEEVKPIHEESLEKSVNRLLKSGGEVLHEYKLTNASGEQGKVGKNGNTYFIMFPDGFIIRLVDVNDFNKMSYKGWTVMKTDLKKPETDLKKPIEAEDLSILGPDGEPFAILNKDLVKFQGLTSDEVSALKLSHQTKYMLFEAAKKTSEPLKLKFIAAIVEQIEFEQQKLWHFEPDRTFHKWFEIPGCTCPKSVNSMNVGQIKPRFLDKKCPIHGE